MKECTICGMQEHREAPYKVRSADGTLRVYPGLECAYCGCTEPNEEIIDSVEGVPARLLERCEEVRSEARIKVGAAHLKAS